MQRNVSALYGEALALCSELEYKSAMDPNPFASPRAEIPSPVESMDFTNYALASPWKRFVGAMVDNLLFFPVFFVMIPVEIALGNVDSPDGELSAATWAVGALAGGALLVAQTLLIMQRGQSIGKILVKTRIVKMDGALPGFMYGVFLRSWVPYVIGSFCGLFSIVDALMVFASDRRTLHDQIASTQVIDLIEPQSRRF